MSPMRRLVGGPVKCRARRLGCLGLLRSSPDQAALQAATVSLLEARGRAVATVGNRPSGSPRQNGAIPINKPQTRPAELVFDHVDDARDAFFDRQQRLGSSHFCPDPTIT
jgi:hypothetical protein